jgi:hypothetical protein
MYENVDTKIMIEQISEFFKGIMVLFCSEMLSLLIMEPKIQGIPLVKKMNTRVELKYYGSDYGF